MPLLSEREVQSSIAYDHGDGTLYPASFAVRGLKSIRFTSDSAVYDALSDLLARDKPDVVHLHNVNNVGAVRACVSYRSAVMTAHDFRSVCPANMFYWRNGAQVCSRAGVGPGCVATTIVKDCLSRRPQYGAYHYHRASKMSQLANQFAAVIAPSARARDRLQNAGVSRSSLRVLPYFCPLFPRAEPRSIPETPTIAFIGRIAENKGYQYFIEALGLLPGHVRGMIVGNVSDGNDARILDLARSSGCDDRIELHPWASRDQIVELLDKTSVLVFPSLWEETLGIIGLEALSRGVPVVASNLGGVSEWLRDGENGYLVEPKSASQIRDAVTQILESDDRALDFGMRAIRTIREKFLPQQHVSELLSIYEHARSRA